MSKKEKIAAYISEKFEMPREEAESIAEDIIKIDGKDASKRICDNCNLKHFCEYAGETGNECLNRTGGKDPEDTMELGNMLFGNSRGLFSVDRSWEGRLYELFNAAGLDSYGYAKEDVATERGGFENDVFHIEPYYWGDDEDVEEEPNFWYKPTGFEIQWYKYALRDAWCNKRVSYIEFTEMIDKCIKSLKENKEEPND